MPELFVDTSDTVGLAVEAGYALAIGLLVGLERQHHADEAAVASEHARNKEPPLGVRTFALLALLGWSVSFLSSAWTWLPPAALIAVTAVVLGQYYFAGESDRGLTTEVAALLVFILGMMVRLDRSMAVSVGLVATLLLVSKPWLHGVITRLRRVDITSTVQLLICVAIALPLLPEDALDPWGALPPRKIGMFVVLIAGIGYVGYAAGRIWGARRGAGITGLLGGMTSSTAVTVAMARTGREPGMRAPAQLAVFLANFVMFPRVLVVAAIISPAVAARVAPPLVTMAVVMLAGAAWSWHRLRQTSEVESPEAVEVANPFALLPALRWGAVLCAVFLASVLAHKYLGSYGLYAAAAAAGLADVDAITLAVTKGAGEGTVAVEVGALAIAIAVVVNTLVKGGIAVFAGGRSFAADIVKIFAVAVAGGLVAAVSLLL